MFISLTLKTIFEEEIIESKKNLVILFVRYPDVVAEWCKAPVLQIQVASGC